MSAVNDIWTNLQQLIPNLNSSTSGIIRKIADVVGTVVDLIRLEILRSEQIIDRSVSLARITTRSYYVNKAYAYQDGDDLVVIDPATQELGYATIDPTKQIIKQASIGISSLGVFYLNAATSDANNNIVPLSPEQLNNFNSYYQNFIAMGAQCTVASNNPSIFTAQNLYIRYYATSNLQNVKDSISKALHDIQVQRRDSAVLYINEIETALSNLDGVRDAYFAEVQLLGGTTPITPIDGSILLPSGYFNFDPQLYDFSKTKTVFTAV